MTPPIACNPHAIAPADRPRYKALVAQVRASIAGRRDHPGDGLILLLGQSIALTDLAEWIRMERLCCPFLTFRIEISGANPDIELTLSGPPGTKTILESVFQP